MSTKDTGGQAFPCYERGSAGAGHLELTDPVMTLRDYFAAKAMQAAATHPTRSGGFTAEERAKSAYAQADAMLKARQA